MYEIKKEYWHKCQITNIEIKTLAKKYGGSGVYYTNVFKKYLKEEHSITLEEYFENICKLERPVCKCGICNKKCKIYGINKSNFYWGEYACGRNEGVKKWSLEAKTNRVGSKNPMYNKKPWNKGLTAETNASIKSSRDKNKNKIISEETRNKQSVSAKKRLVHGHSGKKHSEINKQKFRENTLRMIKQGKYKQTKTTPHLIVCSMLKELNIVFEEEKIVDYWCVDIYIPDKNLYIEIDGDYFHSNPTIYTDGPKTKTQKINYVRDLAKNKYFENRKLKLLRIWESDIINNKGDNEWLLNQLRALDI